MMSMALLLSRSLRPLTLSGVMDSTVSEQKSHTKYKHIRHLNAFYCLLCFICTAARSVKANVFMLSIKTVCVLKDKRIMQRVCVMCDRSSCVLATVSPPSKASLDRHSTGRNSTCSSVCSAKCFSSIFLTASRNLNTHTRKQMRHKS